MKKSRPYRRTSVKTVNVEKVVAGREGQAAVVGVDISKDWFDLMVQWEEGGSERVWRADNPGEIGVTVELLKRLAEGRKLTVAMESSGTYQDPFRWALTRAGIVPVRVSGKAVKDQSETFDGVSSSHDGKSAAIIAELASRGKCAPWPYEVREANDDRLELAMEKMENAQKRLNDAVNALEAQMARHWPEAKLYLDAVSATLLQILAKYGGPGGLAGAGAEGRREVARWGGHFLKPEVVDALIAGAGRTRGAPETEVTRERMRWWAGQALEARREKAACEKEVETRGRAIPQVAAMAQAGGWGLATVAWLDLGDPAGYHSGGAYLKAMGMNLKERSSGRYQGQLKISKRGPSRVRRWMYFAVLREVQREPVKAWYARKLAAGKRKLCVLVALMRKLAVALFQVGGRGQDYNRERLFALPSKMASA